MISEVSRPAGYVREGMWARREPLDCKSTSGSGGTSRPSQPPENFSGDIEGIGIQLIAHDDDTDSTHTDDDSVAGGTTTITDQIIYDTSDSVTLNLYVSPDADDVELSDVRVALLLRPFAHESNLWQDVVLAHALGLLDGMGAEEMQASCPELGRELCSGDRLGFVTERFVEAFFEGFGFLGAEEGLL